MDPLKEKPNFKSSSREKIVTIRLDTLSSIEKDEVIPLNGIEKEDAGLVNKIEQEAILDLSKKNDGGQEENEKRKFTFLSGPGM